MKCYICKKEVYSELGMGCKMCGMPLENDGDFCCKSCKNKFIKINQIEK